ncbi:hypothetical protein CYMTET_14101 [Cymbomonas tetramitiformis]|uniref:non-specific serine/threonine protein kinase n=1 Tax=Cymbomonas tetramitiformis TaxID=36881 RepID=A0AAE0GI63_9CHLO|nr:hypothetical protein CYMTET_14101 [Cymbomonas tetramitiformis]
MLVENMSIEEDYIPGEIVGEGAFGKVRTARRKCDDTLVVIKEVSMANMSSKEKEDALTEVKILEDLDHTNIIQYHDCRIDGNTLCIVMEYAEEGELHTLIKSKGEKEEYFPESQILAWFVQLCLALGHVHSRKILHRDLKSQNIFRTKNNILKLGDFGIAKVLTSETQMASTAIGTPYYLSPEICEDKPYGSPHCRPPGTQEGTKSDIWALGCVLYELCSLKRAFDGASLPALVLKILRGKYPPLPGHYSKELRDLVCSLLQRCVPSICQHAHNHHSSGGFEALEGGRGGTRVAPPLVVHARRGA